MRGVEGFFQPLSSRAAVYPASTSNIANSLLWPSYLEICPRYRLRSYKCRVCLPPTRFVWRRGGCPTYQGIEAHIEVACNRQHAGEARVRNLAFLDHIHRIFADANTAR